MAPSVRGLLGRTGRAPTDPDGADFGALPISCYPSMRTGQVVRAANGNGL